MNPEALAYLLAGIKAQIAGVQHLLNAAIAMMEPPGAGCEHPPEKRKALPGSTMGEYRWRCEDCGAEGKD